jgi:hypothetical protein
MQSINAKLVVVVVLACTGLVGRNGLVDFGLESRAGGAGRPSSNVPSDDPSGTHATAKWRQVRFRATIGTGETPSQVTAGVFSFLACFTLTAPSTGCLDSSINQLVTAY